MYPGTRSHQCMKEQKPNSARLPLQPVLSATWLLPFIGHTGPPHKCMWRVHKSAGLQTPHCILKMVGFELTDCMGEKSGKGGWKERRGQVMVSLTICMMSLGFRPWEATKSPWATGEPKQRRLWGRFAWQWHAREEMQHMGRVTQRCYNRWRRRSQGLNQDNGNRRMGDLATARMSVSVSHQIIQIRNKFQGALTRHFLGHQHGTQAPYGAGFQRRNRALSWAPHRNAGWAFPCVWLVPEATMANPVPPKNPGHLKCEKTAWHLQLPPCLFYRPINHNPRI